MYIHLHIYMYICGRWRWRPTPLTALLFIHTLGYTTLAHLYVCVRCADMYMYIYLYIYTCMYPNMYTCIHVCTALHYSVCNSAYA